MLITLQSNNDGDAASFSNHFKQNIIIPKDSKIALTDISYKFDSGITVTNATTFDLILGTEQILNITVAQGEYTEDTFVTALNTSLDNAISAASYRTQKAFPSNRQVFSINSDGHLVLDLVYDPQDWEISLARPTTTIEREKLDTSDDATMTAGNGIVLKATTSDAWTTDLWAAGSDIVDGDANLWGFANNNGTPSSDGKIRFRAQQAEGEFLVGMAEQVIGDDMSDDNVAFIKFNNGQYQIWERNTAGTPQDITTAVGYEAGKDFVIQVEEVKTGGTGEIKYFYDGSEVPINTGADRWLVRNTSQLIPCGSFYSKKINSEIVADSGTFKRDRCIKETDSSITDGGSGYIDGEYCELIAASGSKTTCKITVDVDGSILTYAILSHGGNIAFAGENINFQGLMSGTNSAVLATGVPSNSNTIVTGGSGYSIGIADFDNNAGSVNILTVDGSGAITDFEFNDRLPNVATLGTFNITQGANSTASIRVNVLSANIPSIGNLSYDIIPFNVTNEPLVEHSDLLFGPSQAFADLTNTTLQAGDQNIEVVGTARISNDRETSMMLVNIDQFELSSICKDGGLQKAISAVPYGLEHPNSSDTSESRDGEYYYRPYNLLYQKLGNKSVINHNQLQVRLTDPLGNPLQQLKHPTTLTIDLQ